MSLATAFAQAAHQAETGTALATPASSSATPFFARETVRMVCVLLQFGLLVYLVRQFDIERGPLGDVLVLAWLGFAVHHYLPLWLRLPFFTVLSMASIPLVVGVKFGAIVWVGGLLLIAVCHAPCRLLWRLLGLGVVACLLLLLRQHGTAPAIVVLASMFMFRTIIYLYDLKHQSAPFSCFRATSYFFMLPNAVFAHFPIVDYKTFGATHYNDTPLRVYQTGLRWMLRGLLHLMLYRILYQFAQVDPLTVTDLGGAARFMVVTFLLYLRVSGQFHLIVGTLHLFGFNLPETHHLYLLSSSFLDLWRRINIYWKDFILKIFFNPAYFALKRLGPTWALVIATLFSFFWTGLLHDYQTMWLRGSATITWQNFVFWTLLGLLVLASALWEMWRGRQRAVRMMRRTWRTELHRALCTIATFVTLCVLWTLWSSPSAAELEALVRAATNVTLPSVLAVTAGLAGLGVASVVFGRSVQERMVGSPSGQRRADDLVFWPSAGLITAGLVAFLLFGMAPSLPAARDTLVGDVVLSLKQDRLNEMDINALTRGYYEDLDVTRQDDSVALAIQPVPWWPSARLYRQRDDFMLRDPIPNIVANVRGKTFAFNRLGMRGPLYLPAKPPGVFRIAVVGQSHEVGRGVDDHECYPRLLEERLNREDVNENIRRFEVLNFSVEGYGAIQQLYYLRDKALAFNLDLVLWTTCRRDSERMAFQLAVCMAKGHELPGSIGSSIPVLYVKAGVNRSTPTRQMERSLLPHMPQLMEQVYQEYAATCNQHRLRGCIVYRPTVREFVHLQAADRHAMRNMAEAAGLHFLDLASSYAGIARPESLMVEPDGTFDWRTMRREGIDDHPNELAHRLLADELYRQLHAPENCELLKRADTARDK